MLDYSDLSDATLAATIQSMRSVGADTYRVEVKAARGGLPQDIGRTVSAFANASGGLIVCGVSEADGFMPVEGFDPVRIQDALAQYCTEKMTPPVHPIIEMRPFEGSVVVTAYISELQPREKPCYVTASGRYGGSYLRVGDGDRRLTSYEVDRFMEERRQPRHDVESVPGATLADLDPVLVRGLLERERQIHPRNFAALDDESALKKLHVLVEEEGELRPTLAGLLALGSYPQEFFPRLSVAFTCYPGTEKGELDAEGRRFVDALTCVGSIPAMVRDVLSALLRNMRTGAKVVDGFRYDVPDYPLVAVREAVVNALMHRDYSEQARGSSVAVDLYADRLEISNLGGLYGSVTPCTLGTAVASARNQFLSAILESTPFEGGGYVAENRGSGYRTIEQELERAGMPEPAPHNSPTAFTLTMRRKGVPGADPVREARLERWKAAQPARVDMVETARYTKTLDDVVVEVIEMRGSASMSELVAAAGKSRPTVLKVVQRLVDEGTICPTETRNSPKQRYKMAL